MKKLTVIMLILCLFSIGMFAQKYDFSCDVTYSLFKEMSNVKNKKGSIELNAVGDKQALKISVPNPSNSKRPSFFHYRIDTDQGLYINYDEKGFSDQWGFASQILNIYSGDIHFVMYIYSAFGSSSLEIETYLAGKKYESISIPLILGCQTEGDFYKIISEFLSKAQRYKWPDNLALLPSK